MALFALKVSATNKPGSLAPLIKLLFISNSFLLSLLEPIILRLQRLVNVEAQLTELINLIFYVSVFFAAAMGYMKGGQR